MYRTTRKKRAADRKFAAMRATRARTRLETDEPIDLTVPYQPPELRRVVIVIDYDLGESRTDVFRLRRSTRIDSYEIDHNGAAVSGRMG